MQGFQAICVVTLAFIIAVNCVNLENSISSVNETESRADDKCIQKCGQDPSIMCIGNSTSSRNIICSCKDETEAYDKKSRQCLDKCIQKCGQDPSIMCIGNSTSSRNIICSCKDETEAYDKKSRQCLDRCTVKCGTNRDITCEGDQSSDETTICSCIDKKNVYRDQYCFSRCFLKCGMAECTGDQTSDDTTICNCYSGYIYNEKTRKCERRCKLKCGNGPYVKCTGDEKSDETTICSCERDNLIFEKRSKTCIKRCTMKCGWDSNIKCEGDQKTNETTICGCRNPIRVYDKESQTCKVKCDCENGICEEDENGVAICRCLPEYGRVSDVRCEECGCGKGANCTFENSSQKKKCICREGYSEVNGTCKGDCSRSPCKNGGTCRIEAEDITCNCMQDFSGEFCEERDKCVEKCGKDPGVVCIGDLTLAESIICSCRDETETYDEKSHQCIDRCVKKCGDDQTVKCEGDQKTDETTICSCKNKTQVYSSYYRKCEGRCAAKCGSIKDIQCDGDQTSDETTICGCANKKYVYKSRWCFSRCFLKCGSVLCTGNQTSDDTTICDCRHSQVYDEKSGRCEDRCKVKCGNNNYVTCKGNKLADETTICGCNRKDRIFHEKSLTCIKRCTNKCGWDPNIKCEGDQMTDEMTICGCRDPNRFYDVESQTCKVKCDCENGICDEDVNGIAICRCLPEYGKISNVRCEECGCGKGANCTFESSSKKKNCICREGYSVINGVCKGDCSNSPCKNGGTCRIVANDIICDCKQSFTGEYCEKIDYCDSNPCRNGGTCRSTEDNFECTCGEIYGGKDCSENIWCDKNGQDLCGNEKCLYNETLGRGYCVCENGSIFDESTKTCTSVHCASHPCMNGGTCTDDGDTFKCTCPEYFGGKDCSENKVCDIYGKDICGNEKCIVDEQGEINCICEDGKVFDWLSKECRVDQCALNPCKNGGSCVNKENTYRCICPITYSGRDCSENTWCLWYGRKTCGEASCLYDDISRKASCICPSNKEFDEKLKTCTGVCNPNPCVHGICINDGKKHSFCKCFGSYTGNFCNETITDPCTPNPCQNGGSCMVTYGSEFMCICSILYSGSTCEYGNKIMIIMLLAALGAAVLTLVCCGVYCCKRNQKLKKMSSSTGIHHAPQTVMSPESLQSNVYPSAPRY